MHHASHITHHTTHSTYQGLNKNSVRNNSVQRTFKIELPVAHTGWAVYQRQMDAANDTLESSISDAVVAACALPCPNSHSSSSSNRINNRSSNGRKSWH
jgi:hypothetical protein